MIFSSDYTARYIVNKTPLFFLAALCVLSLLLTAKKSEGFYTAPIEEKMEFAAASYHMTTASFNEGALNFINRDNLSTGNFPLSIIIGFFDGNDILDVASVNSGFNITSIFSNPAINDSSLFSFSEKKEFTETPGITLIKMADIDVDELKNIIMLNAAHRSISVLRNASKEPAFPLETFTTGAGFFTRNQPSDIGFEDMNGDGKKDLVSINSEANTISVFLNTSSLRIPANKSRSLPGNLSGSTFQWGYAGYLK